MGKAEFLKRLGFSEEWVSLDLYPDDLFRIQLTEYEPQHAASPEHTRNGAYIWWLHGEPGAEILKKLALASLNEADAPLRNDIQRKIREAKNFTEEVNSILIRGLTG